VFAQWILLILYVGIGVANIVRGVLGFFVGPVLTSVTGLLTGLSVVYIAWGLVFLVVAGAYLATRKRFAPRAVVGCAVLYQATLWVTKLAGDHSSYARRLWPRDVVLTGVFIGLVILLTWAANRRRSGRRERPRHDANGG
jgi:hypothetical protein